MVGVPPLKPRKENTYYSLKIIRAKAASSYKSPQLTDTQYLIIKQNVMLSI